MRCPYCQEEMTQGYLKGQGLFWGTDLKTLFRYEEDINLSEGNFTEQFRYGGFLTAHYCETCELFLAYRPEKKKEMTWEERTEQAKTFAKKTIKKLRKEEP